VAWPCNPKQKKLKRLKRVNKTYHQLRVLLVLLTEEKALDDLIKEALAENNTPVSNSQLQGWRVLSGHKNFRVMKKEDFLTVMTALVNFYQKDTE